MSQPPSNLNRALSGQRCYLIAEVGANHNGDWEVAAELTRRCADAGADAVKFQAYSRESLYIPDLPKEGTDESAQRRELLRKRWDLLPEFTAPDDWWPRLAALCGELGVDFLCTPFDLERLALLAPLVPALKIASGDLTWHELLEGAGATGKPVIFSTGASTLDETVAAVHAVRRGGPDTEIAVLHCVSNYPPKWEDANLRAIPTLAAALDLPVGLSDHTPGSTLPVAAVTLGACIIEKHVTLDRDHSGLDHHFAMTPEEFGAMVSDVRHLEAALGSGEKTWADDEEIERFWVRRGLWVTRDLPAGHEISRSDLSILRPCSGLEASQVSSVIGQRTRQPISQGTPLQSSQLDGDTD